MSQNTCPTPLTVAQLREKSFQKTLEEKTVYFRLAGDIAREPVMSIGTNLDTVLPTINFRSFHMDNDEITCFASEADLLAYEQYHDVIHPIGDIEVVSKIYTNAEMTAAYTKCLHKASLYYTLEDATYQDNLDAETVARKKNALLRHIELLNDALQILEGNALITDTYLNAK